MQIFLFPYRSPRTLGRQTKDKKIKTCTERERERVTADDVAEMWDVVDVWQGAGDEDVPLAFDRKLLGLPLPCDVVPGISHLLPTLRANREIRRKKKKKIEFSNKQRNLRKELEI